MQFLFAEHTLDTDRCELLRGSAPIAVEPQVFDLLVYLLRNRHLIRTVARKGVRFIGEVRVLADGGSPAHATELPAASRMQASRRGLPPSDRPAIAVLHFVNMSGDPEQGYFADGISLDIITALSKQRWFFVSRGIRPSPIDGRARRAPTAVRCGYQARSWGRDTRALQRLAEAVLRLRCSWGSHSRTGEYMQTGAYCWTAMTKDEQ